jgi:hypothetical protein
MKPTLVICALVLPTLRFQRLGANENNRGPRNVLWCLDAVTPALDLELYQSHSFLWGIIADIY